MILIHDFVCAIETTIGSVQVKKGDRIVATLRSDYLWQISLNGQSVPWALTDDRLNELAGHRIA